MRPLFGETERQIDQWNDEQQLDLLARSLHDDDREDDVNARHDSLWESYGHEEGASQVARKRVELPTRKHDTWI